MTDIELIKSKLDIAEFISEYIPLKKSGRNFKALCPFHGEKTPSFIVSPERGSWYCFGACHEGGDVISFLQKWENIEFIEALKTLADKAGVTLSSYTPTPETELKEKLYEINHLASEFYHYLLTSHKIGNRARKYLASRNIKKETIATFKLGYAPDSWDNLLRYLTKKGYSTSDIFTAGLLVKSEEGTFYDRFRGRLMFSLKDPRGNIVGFSGRKLFDDTEKEAKYINTAETPVYIKGNTLYGLEATREAIKKEKVAIVVEGEFDFLASFQIGVTNVVAIKGSALTESQILLLKRYTESLVLALDSDFAGSQAAKRGIELADSAGMIVKVVKLLSGKDPAECVSINPQLWKKAVKEAVSIYDFIIEAAFAKYDGVDAISKKRIGDEVIPFLAKINNPILSSHYVKYLAKRLAVSEEGIELAIRQFHKKQEMPTITRVILPPKKARDHLLEEHLLSLIIQSEKPEESLNLVMTTLEIADFHQPPVQKIVEQLILYFKKHKKLIVKSFSKVLTAEVAPAFDRAFMVDIERILTKPDLYERELVTTVKMVKRETVRRKVNNLSTKIRQEENQRNEDKVAPLNEELRQLLAQLRGLDSLDR